MVIFSGRKKDQINFLRAKAHVFRERLANNNISRETYLKVIERIRFIENVLGKYPFYHSYLGGSLDKKGFLENLHSFHAELMEAGISWKELQEIISQVQLNEQIVFEELAKEEIEVGHIKGTIFRRGTGHRNGIVITHGIAVARYTLLNLAESLAQLGYLVLAIDLPQHHKNRDLKLRLGNIAELIRDSVMYLRDTEGVRNVSVIGHSLGSVGTLFASVGYTRDIERKLYDSWEKIVQTMRAFEKRYPSMSKTSSIEDVRKIMEDEGFQLLFKWILHHIKQIKKLIIESLKNRDTLGPYFVNCCVIISMPINCKGAFAGVTKLRHLPEKWMKRIWDNLIHNPQVKFLMKSGNPLKYVDDKEGVLRWQYLRLDDPIEFLEYLLELKEPGDFIDVMNRLSVLLHKDKMMSLIEYYRKKYLLSVPKLFIYGRYDLLLRPFIPGMKKKINGVYESYGNAKIVTVASGHLLTKKKQQVRATVNITNEAVLQNIISFLDKNLTPTKVPQFFRETEQTKINFPLDFPEVSMSDRKVA